MKKLRAAVIGVGYLGNFHVQKYLALDDVEPEFEELDEVFAGADWAREQQRRRSRRTVQVVRTTCAFLRDAGRKLPQVFVVLRR